MDEAQIRARAQGSVPEPERHPGQGLPEPPPRPQVRLPQATEAAPPLQRDAATEAAAATSRGPGHKPQAAEQAVPSQPAIEKARPARDAVPKAESGSGLTEKLLARATSRAHLPLVEPRQRPARGPDHEGPAVDQAGARDAGPASQDVPRAGLDGAASLRQPGGQDRIGRWPAKRPKLDLPRWAEPGPPSARPAERLPTAESVALSERPSSGRSSEPAPSVAPPAHVASSQAVQRLPLAAPPAAPRPEATVIQRAQEPEVGDSPEPEAEQPVDWDLDGLARRVYPLIRQMLAIERERLPR